MGAFDKLQNHFLKSWVAPGGNAGKPVYLDREEGRGHVEDGEVVRNMSKDNRDEALKTAEDQGIDPNSEEFKRLLEGISRSNTKQRTKSVDDLSKMALMKLDPSQRGTKEASAKNDPETATKAWGIIFGIRPDLPGDETLAGAPSGTSQKHTGTPEYAAYEIAFEWVKRGEPGGVVPRQVYRLLGKDAPDRDSDDDQTAQSQATPAQLMMLKQRISKGMSPALANLLAAAAGWALSSDVASKEIPAHMSQEWERTLSRKEKERLQEEMLRKLRRKVRKSDDGNFLDEFEVLYKDHAPVPPRQGLMFDPVKHRWTRPEKMGRTVWEVQGHKRFRGTGTGAHERGRSTKGHGGYGPGSTEAGRRFRSTGDAGRLHPHEAKHPGQRHLLPIKRKKKTKRRAHAEKK